MNNSSQPQLPYTRTIARGGEDYGQTRWVAGQSILTYGVRIGIRTNEPQLLDRLPEHFPPMWEPTSAPYVERLFTLKVGGAGLQKRGGWFHELFEDAERGARSRSLNIVLEDFERRVKMYVAEMTPRFVFVHAGVVGWRGQAIIIPGRSFSGKTSLVSELVRAGATYYSDEYAVLDMQGRVHAYPQPLQIRESGSHIQKKRRAEEIGGITGTEPLPIGLVIVSRYKPDARWRPARLTTGQAMLEMLANTVPARRKPEIVIPTLQKAISEAMILKGVRGEAEDAARLILKRFDP